LRDHREMKSKNLALFFGLLVLALAFNNFTKGKEPISNFIALSASQNFSQKVAQAEQSLKSHLQAQPGFCESSQNYSCLQKIFSSQFKVDANTDLNCVKLLQGGEICPEGKTFFYDSTAARAACGPNCKENYDYKEFDCHLKLRSTDQEIFPLVVTERSLEAAIEKLHSSCLEIQGEPSK
jgi:RAB protein geranylgeranyltransferase component A